MLTLSVIDLLFLVLAVAALSSSLTLFIAFLKIGIWPVHPVLLVFWMLTGLAWLIVACVGMTWKNRGGKPSSD